MHKINMQHFESESELPWGIAHQDTGLSSIPQPLDICYFVIDCLQRDKDALARCALVCQAWLHPARTHLFHSLDIALESDETFGLFCRFILDHPVIASYIRHLAFYGSTTAARNGQSPRPVLPLQILSELVAALPRIQVLKLMTLALDPKKSDDIESAQEDRVDVSDNRRYRQDGLAVQSSLEELHIISCSSSRHLSYTVADTMATLRLFHSVDRFVWSLAFWAPPRTTTEIPEQPSSSVRVDTMKLMLNHLGSRNRASSALPNIILPPSLSTLSVHSAIFWKEVRVTGALLRTAGRNLKHLTLNFYSPIGFRCSPPPGSLSQIAATISADGLSSLETLGCTVRVEDPLDVGCRWLSVLAALISTAGPSLRTVQIAIQVDNGGPGADAKVDWAQLDQSMDAHSGLQSVEVVFRCHPNDLPNTTRLDPEEVVKSSLRAASARGIVRVAVEADPYWKSAW